MDLITAFFSLYYLPADDMARIVRRSSELGSTIVLQANTAKKDLAKLEKASVGFLKRLLEDNGFSEVEVFAPPGYSRRLVEGTTADENLKNDRVFTLHSTIERNR